MAKGKTKRVPKNALKLADLEQSKSAVLTSHVHQFSTLLRARHQRICGMVLLGAASGA